MIRFRAKIDNQDGSALVFMVVGMLGVLSLGALAVDMGMMRTAHGEAQRAADAAALAGASAFIYGDAWAATSYARNRALDYAKRNELQNTAFSASEVNVEVIAEEATVRVTLRRPAVSTWFARVFGVKSAPVSATAAARATDATSVRCVKPFVPPDMWSDADDDVNRNRVQDNNERWKFETGRGDFYSDGKGGKPATGYGSPWRDKLNDRGRRIELTESGTPGFANLWAVPDWDGSVSVGGAELRDDIRDCTSTPVVLGKEYRIQMGIKAGPVYQGVEDLIARDPGARWDDATKTVVGSKFADWHQSPRMIRIPFFDPSQSGCELKDGIKFTKFAWVFLEPMERVNEPVSARFVEIVRILKLVE